MENSPQVAEGRMIAVQQWTESHAADSVNLRLVKLSDAPFILALRTNPQLNRHLSAVENSLAAQEKWIIDYLGRESSGDEFYFIVRFHDAHAGTVRIYDLRDGSFCWGSWIIRPRTPHRVALRSVALVYELGCRVLGFPQSHFDVRKDNVSVNRFHQRMGAAITAEDELNFYYTITAQQALAQCQNW